MTDYIKARDGFNKWETSNQVCVILAAAVPIIITILTTAFHLITLANLLDAVFPTCVGLIRGKIKVWRERDGTVTTV